MASQDWTRPEDIRAALERLWTGTRTHPPLLGRLFAGDEVFPVRIPLRGPKPTELATDFAAVRGWIKEVEDGEAATPEAGYRIEWQETNNRVISRQTIPVAVVFESPPAVFASLRRRPDAERFAAITAATVPEFPGLAPWFRDNALVAVDNHEAWPEVLAVARWFRANPRSGLYLRQLDIDGVHTKFIEWNRPLLTNVLPHALLTPEAREEAGKTRVEALFGLREKDPRIRLRLLDPALAWRGVTDLEMPVSQAKGLELEVDHVFVTENEINGLAFPAVKRGVVLFRFGYPVSDLLRDIPWLAGRRLHYWGDIDTHGLVILGRLRGVYPRTEAMLMDRATLLANRRLWTKEDKPHTGAVSGLDSAELALLEDLRGRLLGEGVRLEQERIPFHQVEAAVASVLGS